MRTITVRPRQSRTRTLERDSRIDLDRDENGVLHVRATSEADLYHGLGYCHGVDRGLQMLLTRTLAQGRASELLQATEESLTFDRFFRRVNVAGGAEGEAARLSHEDHDLLEAYCDGVNRALLKRLPWELRLVGYKLDPWTPGDAVTMSRLIGYVQVAQHQEIMERLLIEMVQAGVPRDHLDALFPDQLELLDLDQLKKVKLGERVVPEAVQWNKILPRAVASNNWVIAPSRTSSGHAILASDPHLEGNRLPAVWYEAVLELGDRYCFAATMPGIPTPVLGRTNDLAWAPTYACVDAIDSWVEDCRDGCFRRTSEGEEQWEPFQVRHEVIRRKRKDDVVEIFYENGHGVLDGDPSEAGLYLATRWSAGQGGAASLGTGFGVFRASDVAAGMDALGDIETAWNWVLADRDGDIGYQMSGRMPIRREGWTGLVAIPGWEPTNDWQGFYPSADLPRARNPECGFIGTANHDLNHLGRQRPINLPMGGDRSARIEELLAQRADWTVPDVQRMQMDLYSRQAERFMAVLEPLLPAGPAADTLRSWDLSYDADSYGAPLFENFYRELVLDVFGSVWGPAVIHHLAEETSVLAGFYANFDRVLLSEQSVWFGADGRDGAFARAVDRALERPVTRWGDSQRVMMRHLMFGGRLPAWAGFDHGPIVLRGGRATIHQGQVFRLGDRETTWTPSLRFVTDLGEPIAHTALAGGPSDRRFSRWYTSGVSDWLEGRFKQLRASTPTVGARSPKGLQHLRKVMDR